MCHAVYTQAGERLGSIADLEAAGFVVLEADRFSEAGTFTTPDGQVHHFPAHRASDTECLCSVDAVAVVERSGRAFTIDPDLGDVILARP